MTNQAPPQTGILLCNLGTPEEPTPKATKKFLAQFLSDKRVVEIPAIIWQPILRGLVLTTRPAKSAAKYKSIWTEEGSPLLVWTKKQTSMLRGYIGEHGVKAQVAYAMRYGSPSVPNQIKHLKEKGCTKIIILPLYPQYSCTTTASIEDEIQRYKKKTPQKNQPQIILIKDFHDHPAYIKALTKTVHHEWQNHGQPEKLIISFHGVPEQTIKRGDPYQAQCEKTATLLAHNLGLNQDKWVLSYQSKFGRAKWIEPSTQDILEKLGREKKQNVHVICPGFVSDCIETLEEISIEGKHDFQAAGGGQYKQIPCLNDSGAWITAIVEILSPHIK